MAVKYSITPKQKELVICLEGGFDFNLAQSLQKVYIQHPELNYVIDLRETEEVGSSLLGMLFNMRKTLGDDTRISLIHCCPKVKKILNSTQFDKQFYVD